MERIEREAFLAHSTLPTFKRKVEKAKEFIREAFSISTHPYLACSGGKDSIAMFSLVDEIAIELNRQYIVWGHLSDASFPFTQETIEESCFMSKKAIQYLDFSPVSAFDVIKDSVSQFGKKGYFFNAIADFQKKSRCDLAFIGVRASESARRKKAVKIHGHLFESSVTGIRQKCCYPLAYWNVDDVFAQILISGYPLHPIYSKRHHLGDIRKIRLGYLTSQDLLNIGTVGFIRDNYPQQYQQLILACPKFANYT